MPVPTSDSTNSVSKGEHDTSDLVMEGEDVEGPAESVGLTGKTDTNSHDKAKFNGIVPMTLQGHGNTVVIVSTVLWFVASYFDSKDFTTIKAPLIINFDVEEIKAALKTIQDIARGILAGSAEDIKSIGGNLRRSDRMFDKIHELIHKCGLPALPSFVPGADVSRLIKQEINMEASKEDSTEVNEDISEEKCSSCLAMEQRMDKLEKIVEQALLKRQDDSELDKKNRMKQQQRLVQETTSTIREDVKVIKESVARLEAVTSTAYRSAIIHDGRTAKEQPGSAVNTSGLAASSLNTTSIATTTSPMQPLTTDPPPLHPHTPQPPATKHPKSTPQPADLFLALLGLTAEFSRTKDTTKAPLSKQEASGKETQDGPADSHKQVIAGASAGNCEDKGSDLEGGKYQKVDRRKKRAKHLVGTGRMTTMGAFPIQRSSIYVSIYCHISDQQILREVRLQTGDDGYTVEKLQGHGMFSAFKISGSYPQIRRLKSPDVWPAGARVRNFYETKQIGVTSNKN